MKRGLTLIEILITSAILSLVGVAIYSTFANGLAIWKRANIINQGGNNLRLSLEKINSEIRNTYNFSQIPFEGGREFISFPALIQDEKDLHYRPGQISYIFDPGEGALFKEKRSYSQIYQDKPGKKKIAIEGLKDIVFSFCYFDSVSETYRWKDDWEAEEQDSLPKAVRIEFILENGSGQKSEFIRTIVIPSGTGKQIKKIGSGWQKTFKNDA
jgi:prepilin-type N-terminal cleavage/methylation domain-containing protein